MALRLSQEELDFIKQSQEQVKQMMGQGGKTPSPYSPDVSVRPNADIGLRQGSLPDISQEPQTSRTYAPSYEAPETGAFAEEEGDWVPQSQLQSEEEGDWVPRSQLEAQKNQEQGAGVIGETLKAVGRIAPQTLATYGHMGAALTGEETGIHKGIEKFTQRMEDIEQKGALEAKGWAKPGTIGGQVAEGITQAGTSAAVTMPAYYATAAGVGGILGATGVGAPVALPVAHAAGSLAAGVAFGLAEYDRAYNDLKKANPNINDSLAKLTAAKGALIEGGGETLGTLVFMKFFNSILKPVAKTGAELAESTVKGIVKPTARGFGRGMATEIGTEIGQSGGEAALYRSALKQTGMTDEELDAAGMEGFLAAGTAAIIPTAVSTLLTAGVGAGVGKYRANKVVKALENPNAKIEDRAEALEYVVDTIKSNFQDEMKAAYSSTKAAGKSDEEAQKASMDVIPMELRRWGDAAFNAVATGKAVDVNTPVKMARGPLDLIREKFASVPALNDEDIKTVNSAGARRIESLLQKSELTPEESGEIRVIEALKDEPHLLRAMGFGWAQANVQRDLTATPSEGLEEAAKAAKTPSVSPSSEGIAAPTAPGEGEVATQLDLMLEPPVGTTSERLAADMAATPVGEAREAVPLEEAGAAPVGEVVPPVEEVRAGAEGIGTEAQARGVPEGVEGREEERLRLWDAQGRRVETEAGEVRPQGAQEEVAPQALPEGAAPEQVLGSVNPQAVNNFTSRLARQVGEQAAWELVDPILSGDPQVLARPDIQSALRAAGIQYVQTPQGYVNVTQIAPATPSERIAAAMEAPAAPTAPAGDVYSRATPENPVTVGFREPGFEVPGGTLRVIGVDRVVDGVRWLKFEGTSATLAETELQPIEEAAAGEGGPRFSFKDYVDGLGGFNPLNYPQADGSMAQLVEQKRVLDGIKDEMEKMGGRAGEYAKKMTLSRNGLSWKMQFARQIGKAMGVKGVIFYTGDRTFSGVYEKGYIILNDSPNVSMIHTLFHEVVHHIQKMAETDGRAKKIYQKYALTVGEALVKSGNYTDAVSKKMMSYSGIGSEGFSIDMTEALDEIFAEAGEKAVENPEFWKHIKLNSPSLFNQIVDIIKAVFRNLKTSHPREWGEVLNRSASFDVIQKLISEENISDPYNFAALWKEAAILFSDIANLDKSSSRKNVATKEKVSRFKYDLRAMELSSASQTLQMRKDELLRAGKDPTSLIINNLDHQIQAAERDLREYFMGKGRERLAFAVHQVRADVSKARVATILGQQLYGDLKDMANTTIKEIYQNSFDGIKDAISRGIIDRGEILFEPSADGRTITVTDNGNGMSLSVFTDAFLTIAGTNKESNRPSGSWGVAKGQFLFANQGIEVETVRDGKRIHLTSTGRQIYESLNGGAPLDIDVTDTLAPNGTRISITIPETFTDDNTGEVQDVLPFGRYGWHDYASMRYSPLFENIDVYWQNPHNGLRETIPSGNNFPMDSYAPFATVDFVWGKARIIVGKESSSQWQDNVHVLSNGIHQFDKALKEKPGEIYGKNIDREIYINLEPTIKAGEPGYPFALNRGGFAPTAEKDMQQALMYVWAVWNNGESHKTATGYGKMLNITREGSVRQGITLTPKNIDNLISETFDTIKDYAISIREGKMVVDNRELPALTPEMVRKWRDASDLEKFKIEQSEVDPSHVFIRDNTYIKSTGDRDTGKSLTDVAVEQFGDVATYKYYHKMASVFKEVRDISVSQLRVMLGANGKFVKEAPTIPVGVDIDKKHHGVHIKVPFQGMFINPAMPFFVTEVEYDQRDEALASRALLDTMIHELAHAAAWSHDAEFSQWMSRLNIALSREPNFFEKMTDKIARIRKEYDGIVKLQEVHSGDVGIRDESFKDAQYERRDYPKLEDLRRVSSTEGGRELLRYVYGSGENTDWFNEHRVWLDTNEGTNDLIVEDIQRKVRFKAEDIQKIAQSTKDMTLDMFARIFSPKLQQAMTVEDVHAIAKQYVKDVDEHPAQHLAGGKVVKGDLLEVVYRDAIQRKALEDPVNRLQASNLELELWKLLRSGNNSFSVAVINAAEQAQKTRERGIRRVIKLINSMTDEEVSPQAKAIIVAMTAKWNVAYDKSGQWKGRELDENNTHSIMSLDRETVINIAQNLEKGMNTKKSFVNGIKERFDRYNKNTDPSRSGWRVLPKDDTNEGAAELHEATMGAPSWCMAGSMDHSRNYRSSGDFHIYYEGGIPQIGIATYDGRMREEPHGNTPDQSIPTLPLREKATRYLESGAVAGGEAFQRNTKIKEDAVRLLKGEQTQMDWRNGLEGWAWDGESWTGGTQSIITADGNGVSRILDGDVIKAISTKLTRKEGPFISEDGTFTGDLEISDTLPEGIKKITGVLTIKKDLKRKMGRKISLNDLESAKYLRMETRTDLSLIGLEAPNLKKVGGILIDSAHLRELSMPKLEETDEDITFKMSGSISLPSLKTMHRIFVYQYLNVMNPWQEGELGQEDLQYYAEQSPAGILPGWNQDFTVDMPSLVDAYGVNFVGSGSINIPLLKSLTELTVAGPDKSDVLGWGDEARAEYESISDAQMFERYPVLRSTVNAQSLISVMNVTSRNANINLPNLRIAASITSRSANLVNLKKLIVTGTMEINRFMGQDIELDSLVASERIYVERDAGDDIYSNTVHDAEAARMSSIRGVMSLPQFLGAQEPPKNLLLEIDGESWETVAGPGGKEVMGELFHWWGVLGEQRSDYERWGGNGFAFTVRGWDTVNAPALVTEDPSRSVYNNLEFEYVSNVFLPSVTKAKITYWGNGEGIVYVPRWTSGGGVINAAAAVYAPMLVEGNGLKITAVPDRWHSSDFRETNYVPAKLGKGVTPVVVMGDVQATMALRNISSVATAPAGTARDEVAAARGSEFAYDTLQSSGHQFNLDGAIFTGMLVADHDELVKQTMSRDVRSVFEGYVTSEDGLNAARTLLTLGALDLSLDDKVRDEFQTRVIKKMEDFSDGLLGELNNFLDGQYAAGDALVVLNRHAMELLVRDRLALRSKLKEFPVDVVDMDRAAYADVLLHEGGFNYPALLHARGVPITTIAHGNPYDLTGKRQFSLVQGMPYAVGKQRIETIRRSIIEKANKFIGEDWLEDAKAAQEALLAGEAVPTRIHHKMITVESAIEGSPWKILFPSDEEPADQKLALAMDTVRKYIAGEDISNVMRAEDMARALDIRFSLTHEESPVNPTANPTNAIKPEPGLPESTLNFLRMFHSDLPPRDMKRLESLYTVPFFFAKDHPSFLPIFNVQRERTDDRNTLNYRLITVQKRDEYGDPVGEPTINYFVSDELSKSKRAELFKLIVESDEENRMMSDDELRSRGMNDSQIKGYHAWKEGFEQAFETWMEAARYAAHATYRHRSWYRTELQPYTDRSGSFPESNLSVVAMYPDEKDFFSIFTNKLSDEEKREFKAAVAQVRKRLEGINKYRQQFKELNFYMPRFRDQGEIVTRVWSGKPGDSDVIESVRSEYILGANKDREALRKKYPDKTVTQAREPVTPESMFEDLSPMKLERFIQEALERAKDQTQLSDEELNAVQESIFESIANELNARGFMQRAIHRRSGNFVVTVRDKNGNLISQEGVAPLTGEELQIQEESGEWREMNDKEYAAAYFAKVKEAEQEAIANNPNANVSAHPRVIKGYKEDDGLTIFHQYMSGLAGFLSKKKAAIHFFQELRNVGQEMETRKTQAGREYQVRSYTQPRVYQYAHQYVKDMLRNQDRLDTATGRLRLAAYFYNISGKISAAAVNMTQPFITAIPVYARHIREAKKKGVKYPNANFSYMKAMRDVLQYEIDKKAGRKNTSLSDEEQRLLKRAQETGEDTAQYLNEVMGKTDSRLTGFASDFVRIVSVPFAAVEAYNRKTAMVANMRLEMAIDPREEDKRDSKKSIQRDDYYFRQAVDFSNQVNFVMGKSNLPEWGRSGTGLAKGLRTAYTFRGFNHNYVLLMREYMKADPKTGKRQYDVLARSLAFLALFGGAAGVPFWNDLMELLEKWNKTPYRALMRKHARAYGTWADHFMTAGLPGLFGFDLSGSLSMGIPLANQQNLEESIYGVYGGMMQRGKKAFDAAARYDYARAAEFAAPMFVANPLRAYRESTRGVTSSFGTPLYQYGSTDEKIKLTGKEAALRTMGFRPIRESVASQEKRSVDIARQALQEQRQTILDRIELADPAERGRIIAEEVPAFNRSLIKNRNLASRITGESIHRVLNKKPDKTMQRFEAGNLRGIPYEP